MIASDADVPKKAETPIDLPNALSATVVAIRDLVRWNGVLTEVTDTAHLAPFYDQVVLQRLDRRALPISLSVADLTGAEIWHFAGQLR